MSVAEGAEETKKKKIKRTKRQTIPIQNKKQNNEQDQFACSGNEETERFADLIYLLLFLLVGWLLFFFHSSCVRFSFVVIVVAGFVNYHFTVAHTETDFRLSVVCEMAVFLINICKFNGCGIKFDSLGELITHIENIHIDYDPLVVEQKEQSQPACLPLSYVLRFITDAARKEGPFITNNTTNTTDSKRKLAIKHHSYSMSSSNRSNTPTGSEIDDEEMIVSESENSNDSWTTEEFSSEFIMRYGSRHSGTTGNSASNEKPFACPVPGCKKRYKNVNGIKYHSKNGHKKEGKVRKGFKCYCGKSYKTSQGLKNHSMLVHNTASNDSTTTASLQSLSLSQSRSHSPSSVSNGGSTNSVNSNSQSQQSNNNCNSNSNSNATTPVATNHTTSASTTTNRTIALNCTAIGTNGSTRTDRLTTESPSPKTGPTTTPTSIPTAITQTTVPPSFSLITLKTVSNASNNIGTAHAISSAHNPNKLVKMNSDCFDNATLISAKTSGKNLIIAPANNLTNGNILVSSVAAIQNASNSDENSSGKINLPLVNLGILTPATSPKQHTQLASQISPNHTSPTTNNNYNNNNNNHNKNGTNDNGTLPLTPISPNLNKNFNNNNTNTTNNKNLNKAQHLNTNGLVGSAIIAVTEDT